MKKNTQPKVYKYVSIIPWILKGEDLLKFKNYVKQIHDYIASFTKDNEERTQMWHCVLMELEEEIYLNFSFADVGFNEGLNKDFYELKTRSRFCKQSKWSKLLQSLPPRLRFFVVGVYHRINEEHESQLATFRNELLASKSRTELYRRTALWFEKLHTSYYMWEEEFEEEERSFTIGKEVTSAYCGNDPDSDLSDDEKFCRDYNSGEYENSDDILD